MATAYASVGSGSVAGTGGSTNLVITKPTGLAEGDLMVAVVGVAGSACDFTSTGWTSEGGANEGANYGARILSKVATSGDAAASNFTFRQNMDGTDAAYGVIIRFTGTSFSGSGNIIKSAAVDDSAATAKSFNCDITPAATDYVMVGGSFMRKDYTQSGYAIENNDPTWTERHDDKITTGGEDCGIAFATATPSAASTTGNLSITYSTGANGVGFLIAVKETANVTISASPLVLSSTLPDPVITGDSNVSVNPLIMTSTITDATVTTGSDSNWTQKTKNTGTWTQKTKN